MSSTDDRDVSLMAIDQYMRQMRWTVPLTDEEEASLVQWIQQGKAEQEKRFPDAGVLDQAQRARARLIEGYLPIVVGVARKYWHRRSRGLEFLDLVQEGNLGGVSGAGTFGAFAAYKLVYRVCIPVERREGRKGVWLFPKAAIDALVREGALPA